MPKKKTDGIMLKRKLPGPEVKTFRWEFTLTNGKQVLVYADDYTTALERVAIHASRTNTGITPQIGRRLGEVLYHPQKGEIVTFSEGEGVLLADNNPSRETRK